jgi:hypothetical protein
MRRLLVLVAVLVAAFFMLASPALAYQDAPETAAIRGILQAHDSPMPWWTISAYAHSHPDFDVASLLAVAWAESSLGKGARSHRNVGSIKGGPVGSLWRDLRIGVTRSGYNIYPDMRAGTRALIYLLMERGYNAQLAAGDFWGFARRYYGANIPGIARYVANLQAAHGIIVREAATYGLDW